MKTWLFLGDSITDCGRNFTSDGLGTGYVKFLSQNLPQWNMVNRGTDGFTLSRLLAQAEPACRQYTPSVISVLIGINDVGLMMNTCRTPGQQQEMLDTFAQNYQRLLCLLLSFHPEKLLLLEPFLFPWPLEYRTWFPLAEQISMRIQQISGQHQVLFLPLWKTFLEFAEKKGMDHVTPDGIHLTDQGQKYLADLLESALYTE